MPEYTVTYTAADPAASYAKPRAPQIDSAEAAAEACKALVASKVERLIVLCLDTKHRLLAKRTVSVGTLDSSLVHPREIFGAAIRASAAAIILVHNHPSGDPTPSREDVVSTIRILDAGQLLGIPLLDHVVVSRGGYCSIRSYADSVASKAEANRAT